MSSTASLSSVTLTHLHNIYQFLHPLHIASYLLILLVTSLCLVIIPVLLRYYLSVYHGRVASPHQSFVKDATIYTLILYRFALLYICSTRFGAYFVCYLYLLYRGDTFGFISRSVLALPLIPVALYIAKELFVSWRDAQNRSQNLEYIDMGMQKAKYTQEEYRENLRDMGWLNRYLGADYAIMTLGFEPLLGKGEVKMMNPSAAENDASSNEDLLQDEDTTNLEDMTLYKSTTEQSSGNASTDQISILEVGCGAGWLSRLLAANYDNVRILATDTGKEALEFARILTQKQSAIVPRLKHITYKFLDNPELNYRDNSFDIVTCCLVCHHIQPESSLVEFLKRAHRVSRRAVIISDLERSFLPLFLYRTFIWPIKQNRLTQHDGYLSVMRSFTRQEWRKLFKEAGIPPKAVRVHWTPAQRWIITILKETK